jgi:hypothetical protein
MISKIITGILRAIIEYLTSRKTEVKQPAKQDDVRKAAAKKVGKAPILAVCALLALSGCNDTRIIIVDQTGVVRLLEDSKKVRVLIQTDDGWVQGKTVIPAGWYAMSLTDDEISEANNGR